VAQALQRRRPSPTLASMYQTPTGLRTFSGKSADVIRAGLASAAHSIEFWYEDHVDNLKFDIPVFDQLRIQYKLAQFLKVGRALLLDTDRPFHPTMYTDATVAAIFQIVLEKVEEEIADQEDDTDIAGVSLYDMRKLLRGAFKEQGIVWLGAKPPRSTSRDLYLWDEVITCLQQVIVLHDNYNLEHLASGNGPGAPRARESIRRIPESYFATPPEYPQLVESSWMLDQLFDLAGAIQYGPLCTVTFEPPEPHSPPSGAQ